MAAKSPGVNPFDVASSELKYSIAFCLLVLCKALKSAYFKEMLELLEFTWIAF